MSEHSDRLEKKSFSDAPARDLAGEWRALAKEFSLDEKAADEALSFLLGRYSEKHRYYHNLNHVRALLVLAEDLKENISDYDCVRLAIWFHDVIYNPQRKGNEIESAKLAVWYLSGFGLPENKIRKVERMILATEKHAATAGLDYDGKLFLDLDLSILGADEKNYKEYSRAVRLEYSHVPEALYRESRRKILENFTRREFIYFTGELRRRFEAAARLNIRNEIKELS
jgi:predicted metal-dependent HD superfamily phosphohydrolase